MSHTFAVEATIEASREDVWKVLTTWENAHQWMSGVESIRAEGKLAEGTNLVFRARGRDRNSQIWKLDKPNSMVLRSSQGGVTADYTYSLERLDDGQTRASLVAECKTSGLWRLLYPVLRAAMKRSDSGQMETLKGVVEGSQ